MTRVVKFPISPPEKLGPKKVKRRRKPDLEALGQLNLFDLLSKETRVINLPKGSNFFEEAMRLDEINDPEAERFYQLAIDHEESKADAFCNLGIMKSLAGELAKSIDYLTKCLEINPRHFEAHYNLANVYSDMGNFPLAKTHYEVSIQIDPEFPDSYYNLGLVLISLKSYKAAIEVIHQYVEKSPETDHKVASELIKTLKALG